MKTRPRKNTYECQNCGGVFIKGRSDEQAMAELYARLPKYSGSGKLGPKDDDLGILCEDCWSEFMSWYEHGGKEICEGDENEKKNYQ